MLPTPSAPERPLPNVRAGSSSSRATTHPAQLSQIAGCAAYPGRASRRVARRKFRDGRAAAQLGQHCACLAALAERLMLSVSMSIRVLT